jgi:hypothetical protein
MKYYTQVWWYYIVSLAQNHKGVSVRNVFGFMLQWSGQIGVCFSLIKINNCGDMESRVGAMDSVLV